MPIVASAVSGAISSRSESSFAAAAATATAAPASITTATTAAATVAASAWRSTFPIALLIPSTVIGFACCSTTRRRRSAAGTANSAGVLLGTVVATTVAAVTTAAVPGHTALHRTIYVAFGEPWRSRARTGPGTRARARTGIRAAPENSSTIIGSGTTLTGIAGINEIAFASSLDTHRCHIQKLGIDDLLGFLQDIDQFASSPGVVRCEESVRCTGVVGSCGTSNAMNVILRRSRKIKIYNKLDVVHICK